MDHSQHNHSQHISIEGSNPCTDKLTDIEYLEHMIPHHQVAIDMSNMLIPHTQNPIMLHLCRDITRKQSYEIWEMTMMKSNISDTIASNSPWHVDQIPTKLEIHAPIMINLKTVTVILYFSNQTITSTYGRYGNNRCYLNI